MKFDLKPVNAKCILISSAIACFEALSYIPVVGPLGFKPLLKRRTKMYTPRA